MTQRNPRPWPVIDDKLRERTKARIKRNSVVIPETGCWEWQKARGPWGHGASSLNCKSIPAHRLSYFVFVGPFDVHLDIDHLCRNPPCVNPEHLEPVTPRTNVMRGVSHVAEQVERTHCPKGHAYEGDNLRIRPSGRRACRACQREWTRNNYLKKTRDVDHCKNGHPLAEAERFWRCRSCLAFIRERKKRAA